jgi:hypothetical protein
MTIGNLYFLFILCLTHRISKYNFICSPIKVPFGIYHLTNIIAKREKVKNIGLSFLECMKKSYNLNNVAEALGIFDRLT